MFMREIGNLYSPTPGFHPPHGLSSRSPSFFMPGAIPVQQHGKIDTMDKFVTRYGTNQTYRHYISTGWTTLPTVPALRITPLPLQREPIQSIRMASSETNFLCQLC
jgi:hypothetical protein